MFLNCVWKIKNIKILKKLPIRQSLSKTKQKLLGFNLYFYKYNY